MMADDGLRKVFEIALEELFIEGKLWVADVRCLLPHAQRNANEDTTNVPVEQAVDLDGVHLLWVACFDGALVLLGLGLLVFAVCSVQERSGRGKRFEIWARHNRSYRNKWFRLALLALLVPRSTDAQTYFTVSSGPCTVDPSSPNCIRSPNFPSSYQDNQACTITPTALAIGDPLTATSFSTEACCDRLSIPSYPSGTVTAFSGSVAATFAIAGDPSDFTGSVALRFRTNLASQMGVAIADITLQVTAGSTIVQAAIVVASLAASQTAMSYLGGDTAQLSASLGVTITSVTGI
eukprot:jgi/Chrpa1/20986/Chrysochromulina_OHIO_Genome00026419-RA